ncbi:MAG: ester cyclase [Gammaproteobacteria bacterium]|nr:ester cyclase [Gammaproteobacteria bacterium]
MKGFDSKWQDLPHYILGITREIWEDRQIHSLDHLYSEDIIVRSPGSIVVGNKGVIAATMATLAEFPDRQLMGEDVIWSGDDEVGFLSSHRILSTATHLHEGMYGPASGMTYRYRIIADCAAKDNVIYDEWLIRDQGAIVRQMGWDPKAYAVDAIAREGGPEQCVQPLTPDNDQQGAYQSRGNNHQQGQHYADLLTRIMSAELSAVPGEYDRACHLELPGGVTAHGTSAADQFWMGLRSAFPSAEFKVDHVIGRDDPGLSPRAAVRWSLTGRHEGWGSFGAPTDAEVHVLGISHAEFGPYGLRREYVLFDETAIWKQIALHTG